MFKSRKGRFQCRYDLVNKQANESYEFLVFDRMLLIGKFKTTILNNDNILRGQDTVVRWYDRDVIDDKWPFYHWRVWLKNTSDSKRGDGSSSQHNAQWCVPYGKRDTPLTKEECAQYLMEVLV